MNHYEKEVIQVESSADGMAILSLALILCALIIGFSMVKASENIDIDNIYKINGAELKQK